jgi:tetratricopeptide (TPR) repeat protein
LARRFVIDKSINEGAGEVLYGCSCNLLGRYDEALKHLKAANAVQPKSFIVIKEMAIAYEGLGLIDEADSNFKMAIDLNRRYDILLARAFFLVNCVDKKHVNPKEAERLALEAKAEVTSKDWRCVLALAQAKAAQGGFDQALMEVEEELKADSLHSEARAELQQSAQSFKKRVSYRSNRNLGVQEW